jgi:serine protease Do
MNHQFRYKMISQTQKTIVVRNILECLLLLFWAVPARSSSQPLSSISSARVTPAVKAVNRALPWVVNIGTEQRLRVNDPFDLFFNQFFAPHHRSQEVVRKFFPLGSGVLVDSHGLVLTNFHVVQRAGNVEVRLYNGKSYPAVLVGYDQPNDLCLLRLQGDFQGENALAAASFAQSGDLLLGETVISIGNPFGLEHSVSLGVLSAFNRNFSEGEISFSDIIQTDAAINPGNSGGPLVNLDGDLIGINLAIRQDAQGIGFAIPLSRIELFLSYWLRPSHFANAYFGFRPGADLSLGPNNGICLPELLEDSPLDAAGLKSGDEVISVNGRRVSRLMDLGRAIWSVTVGDKVEFVLASGKKVSVSAGAMPLPLLVRTRLGLSLQRLTPALRQAMGLPDDLEGLAISEIIPQEMFSMQQNLWRDILKRGDIIVEFAGQKVGTLEALGELLADSHSGQSARMIVISINHQRRTYQPFALDVILN